MMFFEIDDANELRAAVAAMCAAFEREAVSDSAVFDCKLVARELLSNALRYGGGRVRFRVERAGDVVKISVKGATDFCPPEKSVCSGAEAERGRGLFLVDAVSESRRYSKEDGICVIVRIG